jgi:hypothetical protein
MNRPHRLGLRRSEEGKQAQATEEKRNDPQSLKLFHNRSFRPHQAPRKRSCHPSGSEEEKRPAPPWSRASPVRRELGGRD